MITGIIHVLYSGCRWDDSLSECGPLTTIYNHLSRWSKAKAKAKAKAKIWQSMFANLVKFDATDTRSIESLTYNAQRCVTG